MRLLAAGLLFLLLFAIAPAFASEQQMGNLPETGWQAQPGIPSAAGTQVQAGVPLAAGALVDIPGGAAQNSSQNDLPPATPEQQGTITLGAVFENGTPASSIPIIILARSNSTDTVYRVLTDFSGRVFLTLPKGSYQIDAILDFSSTPGLDFASTAIIGVPSAGNSTLIFYPAGSVAGRVEYNSAPVPGATVKVACPSSMFDYARINGGTQVTAGEAGDFLFRALPSGSCQVSASSANFAGSSQAQVVHGEVSIAAVEVKQKSSDGTGQFYIFVAGISVLVLGAMAFALKGKDRKENASAADGKGAGATTSGGTAHSEAAGSRKRRERQASAQADEEKSPFDLSNQKVKAVLATLSDREAEILKFLLKSGGRAKRSQIQHKLLIPKTSLLRNLRALERKNIIALTPFGRNLLAEVQESLFK